MVAALRRQPEESRLHEHERRQCDANHLGEEMTKWTSISHREVRARGSYQAPRDVTGPVSSKRLSPPDYGLWLCDAQLDDRTTITWSGEHSDDTIYVLDGELHVGGRLCPSGGAVIVESGATTTAVAVGATRIAHFGSHEPHPPVGGRLGPPHPDGHGVHVVGPGGMFVSGEREGVHAVWFADGTCDTCRAQLLEVTAPPNEEPRGKAHSHSQDEIIYLLDGSFSMGAHSFEPFTALSIPGDVRYALVGGAAGHRFVNFRRDVSEQSYAGGIGPLLETAIARGGHATADLR